MEPIWLLCNEKSPPADTDSHDATDDHEGSSSIWWENQLLCLWRCNRWLVWHHGVRTWETWTSLAQSTGRRGSAIQEVIGQRHAKRPKWRSELLQKISTTSFHQRCPERVLIMKFIKFNRGTMDLQKWVTRFQLTGNRLIESWMDLLPDAVITSPEAILFIQQKRQEHERDEREKAELAAAPEQTTAKRLYFGYDIILETKMIQFFENWSFVFQTITMVNGKDSTIKDIQLLLNIDICSGMSSTEKLWLNTRITGTTLQMTSWWQST